MVGINIPMVCNTIAMIIILTLPCLCAIRIQIIDEGIPARPTISHVKPAIDSSPGSDFIIVGKNVP